MDVYIEYVILDNMSMNWVIIRLIDLTTGISLKRANRWLVCILGTIFAIFLPYLYFNKLLLFLYKFVVSIILVLSMKRFDRFASFFKVHIIFILYTFLLGGVCFGIINLLGIDYTMSGILIYNFEFPMGVLFSIMIVAIRLLRKYISWAKERMRSANYMYKIVITDSGECVDSVAFLDTGNKIAVDGKGVSVISLNLFLRLYKDIDIMDVILKKTNDELKDVKYIDISGIGREEKYLSFVVDKMDIDGRVVNKPRLAVALKNFGDYECILSENIFKCGV